ncbi:hypothetical protein MBMB1_0478 [Methanobacterium sp. MB1]|nr:hypothetical protein MBMB1_0478 [Methanobacterium sp. MB1]
MKFCPECGSENPDNAIHCQECGKKVENTLTEPKVESKTPKEKKQEKLDKRKSTARRIVVYIIGAVIGFVLFSLIIGQALASTGSDAGLWIGVVLYLAGPIIGFYITYLIY